MAKIRRVKITICVNEIDYGQKLTLQGYIQVDPDYDDEYHFSEDKEKLNERVLIIEKDDRNRFIVVANDGYSEITVGAVCKIQYLDTPLQENRNNKQIKF